MPEKSFDQPPQIHRKDSKIFANATGEIVILKVLTTHLVEWKSNKTII